MDTQHFFRTALNERGPKDSFFNEVAPNTMDPNDPNKLKPKQPPVPGGTPPPTPTQPPTTSSQKPPVQNSDTAPKAPGTAPAQSAAKPAAPAATPAPASSPSQKSVSNMTVSASADSEISNGVTLPAGSQAVIAPGDLSGNVNVTFNGKTFQVPDANLKQLIKGGSLKVDQAESMASRFLGIAKASGI